MSSNHLSGSNWSSMLIAFKEQTAKDAAKAEDDAIANLLAKTKATVGAKLEAKAAFEAKAKADHELAAAEKTVAKADAKLVDATKDEATAYAKAETEAKAATEAKIELKDAENKAEYNNFWNTKLLPHFFENEQQTAEKATKAKDEATAKTAAKDKAIAEAKAAAEAKTKVEGLLEAAEKAVSRANDKTVDAIKAEAAAQTELESAKLKAETEANAAAKAKNHAKKRVSKLFPFELKRNFQYKNQLWIEAIKKLEKLPKSAGKHKVDEAQKVVSEARDEKVKACAAWTFPAKEEEVGDTFTGIGNKKPEESSTAMEVDDTSTGIGNQKPKKSSKGTVYKEPIETAATESQKESDGEESSTVTIEAEVLSDTFFPDSDDEYYEDNEDKDDPIDGSSTYNFRKRTPKHYSESGGKKRARKNHTSKSPTKRTSSQSRRAAITSPTSIEQVKDETVRRKFEVAARRVKELQFQGTWKNKLDQVGKPKCQHFMFTYDEMIREPNKVVNERFKRNNGGQLFFFVPDDFDPNVIGPQLEIVGRQMAKGKREGKNWKVVANRSIKNYHKDLYGDASFRSQGDNKQASKSKQVLGDGYE